MKPPLVSVIMPAYNAAKYIGAAVASVLGQVYPDWELIIVDDGSSDHTGEIADSYAGRDARVRVFHRENSGCAAASNFGALFARGEYVAPMDADDIALPERLDISVAAMRAHPEWVAMGGNAVLFSENSPARTTTSVCCDIARINGANVIACQLLHSSSIIRIAALRRVQGYRGCFRAAVDYDLWLRLSEIGTLANIRDILYMYRINPAGLSFATPIPQALGACAAQISYAYRRAGRPDPLDGCPEITYEFMVAKGLMNGRCHRAVVRQLVGSAAQMRQWGAGPESAAARLREARAWIFRHGVYTQLPRLWYHSALAGQKPGGVRPLHVKAWLALLRFARFLCRRCNRRKARIKDGGPE